MASKTSTGIHSRMKEGKVSIKFVKKAGLWCKTWFEYDHQRGTATQKQEWSKEKPSEQ